MEALIALVLPHTVETDILMVLLVSVFVILLAVVTLVLVLLLVMRVFITIGFLITIVSVRVIALLIPASLKITPNTIRL